jgi:tetratricopeptide (TPR) repeat protein
MASVFLSYDREDTDRARHFAHTLEKAGHQVWWDLHVRSGAQFSKVIEEALKAADAVVVLWSAQSIESAWVRDEAAAGRDSGRLVPVTIDGTEPPLGFRQFQTPDLSRWRGRGKPAAVKTLLDDVANTQRTPGATLPEGQPTPKRLAGKSARWLVPVAAIAVLAVLTVTLIVWRPWSGANTVPTLLVTAGRSDSASQTLARDLAVQLGNVPSVQSGSLRLVTSAATASQQPQLILEAASQAQGDGSLVLKNAADGAVIWSHDFPRGQRSSGDTTLQMALTASRSLDCATDALADNGERLPRQARTLYLTTCAQAAEGLNADPRGEVAGLSKVVVDAPRFEPAWRKLLLAEITSIENTDNGQARSAMQQSLRKHIAAARRLDPDMPEATLAEMSLVPPADLETRMRLSDQAYRADANNPAVLIRRMLTLQTVGLMLEASQMAYAATNIDPTSPEAFMSYISALMYNGQTDLAEQQLKRAQRLWPGTNGLDDLEWRFYLRFGDPKIGLQMAADRMMSPTLLLFIQARANPTKENVDKLFAYYADRLKGDPANLPALHILMQAYGQFHREDELYAIMLHWPKPAELNNLEDIWFRPQLREFRRDPRFMQLVARSPLLRYWRTSGKWPDFCKEPDLPYDCEKEAAKYP